MQTQPKWRTKLRASAPPVDPIHLQFIVPGILNIVGVGVRTVAFFEQKNTKTQDNMPSGRFPNCQHIIRTIRHIVIDMICQ